MPVRKYYYGRELRSTRKIKSGPNAGKILLKYKRSGFYGRGTLLDPKTYQQTVTKIYYKKQTNTFAPVIKKLP